MIAEIWMPQIDIDLCIGCGDCIVTCPTDALALGNGTACPELAEVAVLAEPDACNYCGECESICPVGAIALPYQIVMESDV
jgi:NAD-dependent dihydropyrimidine dehydrogenase PreA subunit